jgi:hypothetical protein
MNMQPYLLLKPIDTACSCRFSSNSLNALYCKEKKVMKPRLNLIKFCQKGFQTAVFVLHF